MPKTTVVPDLSTAEVPAVLKVSQRTVKNLIDRGHFPHAYKLDPTRSNSPYRIPRKDLDAYLKKQRGQSASD